MVCRRPKISIIGAGNVGSTCAHWAASRDVGDVVLIDINADTAKGKALDLFQASPIECFSSRVTGGSDYSLTRGSDVVIITAGLPRKPGMSRNDLMEVNSKIVRECVVNAVRHSPDCIIIVVTNPLEAMCHVALKASGFPRERVIGMAGILDSARFRSFIAMELGIDAGDVQALVLGGHGDYMVPMFRYATVCGIPLTQLLSSDRINSIIDRTRNGGTEIVDLLKTGSAYYAPAAGIVQMIEAIVKDKKRYLPCAVHLRGEYGINGIYCGIIAKLGARGVEAIPELTLHKEDRILLNASVGTILELLKAMNDKESKEYGKVVVAEVAKDSSITP